MSKKPVARLTGGSNTITDRVYSSFGEIFVYLDNHIKPINDSKLFAGLMIIILNIASKFMTVKLSKTMEAYLKYTFSRNMLIFVIAWMGSRDLYIALSIMLLFILCMDYLFNEESSFCILPESFTDYHVSLFEENDPANPNKKITPEEIKRAEDLLARAKIQDGDISANSGAVAAPMTTQPSQNSGIAKPSSQSQYYTPF
jgi:hypothetical protein